MPPPKAIASMRQSVEVLGSWSGIISTVWSKKQNIYLIVQIFICYEHKKDKIGDIEDKRWYDVRGDKT